WQRARAALEAVSARTNARLDKIRKLAAKQAGVQLGGAKGYFQLRSFDGKIIVRFENVAVQEFDERLELAQGLVFEAIDECAKIGATGNDRVQKAAVEDLRKIASDAFRPRGREGKIDRQRVRDLLKINVAHDKWRKAQDIIRDCDRTIGHRAYVRVAVQADPKAKPEPIILDICKV
ncbi:MAG: DUF3164 family protein, partial [Opitutae bacterium]|nr:DUF3164 family protein [Opitutae bacterium]